MGIVVSNAVSYYIQYNKKWRRVKNLEKMLLENIKMIMIEKRVDKKNLVD